MYYTVFSNKRFEYIRLTVADPLIEILYKTDLINCLPAQYHDLFQKFIIKINLKDCLLGFVFDAIRHTCLCSQKINEHDGVLCDFEKYQIKKSKQLWLSAPNEHTAANNRGLIIHDFCPYDYCIQLANNETLSFHLESPDDQCAFNRSGVCVELANKT